MNGDAIIEVKGLSHRYGRLHALDDLRFSVGAGEMFGLLGPNGSGKTTLFRILSTLLVPTEGRARVFGTDVSQDPDAVRRRIGVVFQSPSVDGKLTTLENLRHQGHLYGMRGKTLKRRMADVLDRFGLTDRANDQVEKLSEGLRRRVEIAKALLHRPGILLLDEPSTGLDPGARRDLWDYLASLRQEAASESTPTTIVLTSHLLQEAEACERVAILDQGRMVALDRPSRLKAQVGDDVIFADSHDPEQLCQAIRARFGGDPTIIGDIVRLERENAHAFITELVEAFPGFISSVTVRKPTLEDVFTQLTGHQFDEP